MKKKMTTLTICLIAALILGIIILPFGFKEDVFKGNYMKSEWSHDINITNGIADPGNTVTDFTVNKTGEYTFSYSLMPEGINKRNLFSVDPSVFRVVTIMHITDSEGKSIFRTSAKAVYADTVLTLSAGDYRITYSYFTDRTSFTEYAKEYLCSAQEAEELADDIDFNALGRDGSVRLDHSITLRRNNDNIAFSVWVFLIIVLMLILLALFLQTKKPRVYDERQEIERGRGFRLGFITFSVSLFLMMMTDILGILPMVHSHVLYAAAFFPGIIAYVLYCIEHEAYLALNERSTGVTIGFVIVGIANLLSALANYANGKMITGGKLDLPALNILCAILFIVILPAAMISKKISASKENVTDEDDEE